MTRQLTWGLRDYGVAGKIGLDQSVEARAEVIVTDFSDVLPIPRNDGTLWLNVGDAYVSGTPGDAMAEYDRGRRTLDAS